MNNLDWFNWFFNYLKDSLNIDLTDIQKEQFQKYYYFLNEYNKNINLTSKTDIWIILERHFIDCIYLTKYYNFEKTIFGDIGSGAGFPGIIIKILYPDSSAVLFESIKKKALFLESLVKELNLNDVIVISDRVENNYKKYHNSFDVITSRAVGNIDLLSNYSKNILKPNGKMLLMKGPSHNEELKEFRNWSKDFKKVDTFNYELPISKNNLSIINLVKINNKIIIKNY